MDLCQKAEEINKAVQVEDRADASSMSTESLVMSLLRQIRLLEEERDNARFLAANMRERLEHVTKRNGEGSRNETAPSFKSGRGKDHGLAKLLREVSANMVNDLQQIVMNEEQRQHNLKQLAPNCRGGNCGSECQSFEDQLGIYKEHYEKLLEEADQEKAALRKKLKSQQDLVLDRDIKIKELTSMLDPSTVDSIGATN